MNDFLILTQTTETADPPGIEADHTTTASTQSEPDDLPADLVEEAQRAAASFAHRNRVDVDDCLSAALAAAWRCSKLFNKTRGPMQHYLRRAMRLQMLKALDAEHRRRALFVAWDNLSLTIGDGETIVFDPPDHRAAPWEAVDHETLSEALHRLPDKQRIAIEERYLKGRTLTSMANADSISVEAVRLRIARGLSALRKLLEPPVETCG